MFLEKKELGLRSQENREQVTGNRKGQESEESGNREITLQSFTQ